MSTKATCGSCDLWTKRSLFTDGRLVDPPYPGVCGLLLPPWVAVTRKPITWEDQSCSLHRQRGA